MQLGSKRSELKSNKRSAVRPSHPIKRARSKFKASLLDSTISHDVMRQFLCVHARMLRSSALQPAGACAESLWRGRERESARTAADVDRYPSRHMTWRHGVRDSPTNRPSADHALVCFQIVSTKMFLNFFLQIWFEAIRKIAISCIFSHAQFLFIRCVICALFFQEYHARHN